jgi:hypothetical protein
MKQEKKIVNLISSKLLGTYTPLFCTITISPFAGGHSDMFFDFPIWHISGNITHRTEHKNEIFADSPHLSP